MQRTTVADTAPNACHKQARQAVQPQPRRAACPANPWAGSHTAEGWGRSSLHRKGVYSTLCSWRVESSKFFNQSHELSNGRCPGYDFFYPAKTLLARSVSSRVRMVVSTCLFAGKIFHIGVGSDVVCSTLIGNDRASTRGTDNRRFHAFLCPCTNPAFNSRCKAYCFIFLIQFFMLNRAGALSLAKL